MTRILFTHIFFFAVPGLHKIAVLVLLFSLVSFPSFAREIHHRSCVNRSVDEKKLKEDVSRFVRSDPAELARFPIFLLGEDKPLETVASAKRFVHELERKSRILVLLVEFGGKRRQKGPLHNEIEEPGEEGTGKLWVRDFSTQHYQEMLLNLADYYREVSSGRYTAEGEVYGWFKTSRPGAYYGKDSPGEEGSDNANGPVWQLIRDALAPIPAGQIDWASFDKIDRYDSDHDGIIDEPDGYIDHLMVVHAGVDQAQGGDSLGSDAIWSHRSRANFLPPGTAIGPQKFLKLGGIQVDSVNDIWMLDYTMMPENGATGVFAHEFGHDLGLSDLYDTDSVNGSESGVAYWSLMASGGSASLADEPIGTLPTHISSWEKLKLGWLNAAELTLEDQDLHTFLVLDHVQFQSTRPQALKINLPPQKIKEAKLPPLSGKGYFYSGNKNESEVSFSTEVDLTSATKATLTFKTAYDIEKEYDYAYVQIENEPTRGEPTRGEEWWRTVPGSITTRNNPNGNNLGHGITGKSAGWVEARFDLTPFVGSVRKLRFLYVTDMSDGGEGWTIDDVEIDGLLKDDFESAIASKTLWKNNGFSHLFNGVFEKEVSHSYLLEWRPALGFDRSLESIPYPSFWSNKVKRFGYQPGLLLWYRNEAYEEGDNQVGKHPGEGSLLVVDARPQPQYVIRGFPFSSEFLTHDSTFGFEKSKRTPIQVFIPSLLGGTPAVSVFNDANTYYDQRIPHHSVKIPTYGLKFSLVNSALDQSAVQVEIHYTPRVD